MRPGYPPAQACVQLAIEHVLCKDVHGRDLVARQAVRVGTLRVCHTTAASIKPHTAVRARPLMDTTQKITGMHA